MFDKIEALLITIAILLGLATGLLIFYMVLAGG